MKNRPMQRLVRSFPKRGLLIIGLVITVLYSIITVAFSYLIRMVIDSAVDGQRDVFVFFMQVSIVMIILNFVLAYSRTRFIGNYTEQGIASLRAEFGKKVTDISFEDLSEVASGEVLSRGTNDLNRVKQFTNSTLPRLIEIPLTGFLALVLLLVFSWQLTLFSLVMVPILVIGSSLMLKPIGKASKALQEKLGKINAFSIDMIKGAETVKAYQLEAPMKEAANQAIQESVESATSLAKKRAFLESFSMGFSIVPFVTTFILGGYFVISGSMTPGSLLAFINLLNFLTLPLSQMAVLTGDAKRDMAAAERIFEILDTDEERRDGEYLTIDKKSPMVQFTEVSFRYRDSESNVINNLNFSIKANETVAFVGPSGGGKSTVVKLLLGYYDSYQGSIMLGGHELRKWSLKALRETMSIVSQDTYLFPESIKENIRYGAVSETDDAVVKASEKANADTFINQLSEGYNTVLQEHGSSLSGGQRQRLAIARAILKNAPILLLDEATSALDTESEAVVQEAFQSIAKEKTTIIIAHRLSTVEDADRIFVIDKGVIVESGTPKELMDKGGLYTKLYQKQMLEETEENHEEQDIH